MYKFFRLILIILLTSILVTCKDDRKLVTYPKSFPTYDQAQVEEAEITYGDSITLSVVVSDAVTPLSTLEILVVVNNDVITSESVRTKGNNSTVERRYGIPFKARRPDNTAVKVYLSSINVDGYTADTILSSTVVKRPVIDELWFVPIAGTTYKLTMSDTSEYVFHAESMTFGNSVDYYLATKIDKFKKVDWSGLVFGKTDDGIGLIDKTGKPVSVTDPSLVGISKFTFDAYDFTFEIGGKLLEPVTTLDINGDLSPLVMASRNFLSGNVYFGEGVEVTFSGLTDLSHSLPPDYFEITGQNTAIFVGDSAIYKAYYLIDADYLYVEPQPEVVYPECLWVCGTGFGRPSAPFVITSSWNWNTPFDYAPARRVSDGVYQLTIFGRNDDTDENGFGSLDFKFFLQRGWGDQDPREIDASQYTLTPPFFGRTDTGNTGNVNGGPTTFEGVFRITLDENTKTISLEQINE